MTAMFGVQSKGVKRMEADLKAFASRAFPFVTKSTINNAAFTTQSTARQDISKQFTLRNKFTQQSIRVEQSRTLRVSRQAATVGSIVDYMADQEFGSIKTKTGKEGVPIPTSFSAGQGRNAKPRTRLPRRANKLANISIKNKRGRKAKNRKQALLFKVRDAVKTGNRFIFHDFGGGKKTGIYKVTGGRKIFKRGWPAGAKLQMIYDLSEKAVTIPRKPWLKPAVDKVELQIPDFYRKALIFQIRRQGLFKNRGGRLE